MSKWFECKAKFSRLSDDGTQKRVSEPYLVDALSFTEAEARIIEELTPFVSDELVIDAVKKTNIAEVIRDDSGDRWYRVKINIITIDEKTGAEKRSATYSLVQATDFQHAVDNFMEAWKGTIADFEIFSVTETAIMDVFDVKLGNLPEKAE